MSALNSTYQGKARPMKPTARRHYTASAYSDMVVQDAKTAWTKLPPDERAVLRDHLDRIQRYQIAKSDGREHRLPVLATGGIELLAKLGWWLNGTDYVKFIMDSKEKG